MAKSIGPSPTDDAQGLKSEEPNASLLDLAIRVYPEIVGINSKPRYRKRWRRERAMLVFDTETRTDASQSLLFGCFRYIVDGQCVREGLFRADDLSKDEALVLKSYAASHPTGVAHGGHKGLDLLTLDQFLNELYRASFKGRCLVVGFNLPFDLSRLAFDVAPARGQFSGGFSLGLWSYKDKKGRRKRNSFRPRVGIKHVDSKRALIGFTSAKNPDKLDLDREEQSGKSKTFRGHFLDLRTLAFALTDRGHSLKSACLVFGVENGKMEAPEHGKLTARYIDYCRRDVQATHELAEILLKEFDRHPIQLQPTKAFSPASIGKAYLREMGITPITERWGNFQDFAGYAQSAFFGGRTSAHIRKVPIPVVYTDFLSMYPTVNSLMGLWEFVTTKELKIRHHCNEEIKLLLESMTVDRLFDPEVWKKFTGFVRVLPLGDILPTRCQYSETNDFQVAINHLYLDKAEDAPWFALPDVIASVILTGRVPKIIDSFVLEPSGKLQSLRPTNLRGSIVVDPKEQDFFRIVIEERKRLSSLNDLPVAEKERLDKALKVLANSTSYGIYAEMNRVEAREPVSVLCHGIDEKAFSCRVPNPEIPGEFCFPPLASLITGAARLMLAQLEKCVTDLGGTYAMEDTDSMAIVATERGGLVNCPGGPHRKAGRAAIRAISWEQVREISNRFRSLNPYDPDAIRGSILKIEDDNFDPKTGEQRQLWCYAISAKRYALFLRGKDGLPELIRRGTNSKENHWSEHGLGHLLNPSDPSSEDREWIAQVWNGILHSQNGESAIPLFADTPAVGQLSVSNPAMLRVLDGINTGKSYSKQIKPFNSLLSCHVRPLGHPVGIDPTRFHLIAPYETDPRKWTKLKWLDQYSGKSFQISVSDPLFEPKDSKGQDLQGRSLRICLSRGVQMRGCARECVWKRYAGVASEATRSG